ncbi:MAG: 16S rRNA (cytidine(1402)-2'-O)-methyltransferase [Candidatus Omnitrophota bacterium]|jgi:16S rRNA (cytidine1402-2'-O)-methyltransferase
MLSLVATPIGNLRDITLRALDVLKDADLILCEDTRETRKLLDHYEIRKPLLSFYEHSGRGRILEILNHLMQGKKLALVSDGGMPLVSDPGFELLREALRHKLPVEVIPGPSACLTALSVSGLATDSFVFYGFLSPKSATRRRELAKLSDREETLIFYESPYRAAKVLEEMIAALGDREAVVARELTKKFEEISRGRLSELVQKFSGKKILGEIVILVSGFGRKEILPR